MISPLNRFALLLAAATLTCGAAGANAMSCDVDLDQDVDINDVRAITAARNTPAAGAEDPRDANGDGIINVLDARLCVLQCTLPRCAEPPPPEPPVEFVLDEANIATAEIGAAGGTLELDVPNGPLVTLNVPPGAFEETVSVEMQSLLSVTGLPDGVTPIAGVRLGPSGLSFGFQPVVTFDVRLLDRGTGAVIGFLANDDGTGLTTLAPIGTGDPIAASAGNGPFSFDVPHFSAVVPGVSDPSGPGLPDPDASQTVEEQVMERINKRIEEEVRKDLEGDPDVTTISEIANEELPRWLNDLRQRAADLENGATLEDIVDILNEGFRYIRAEDELGADDVTAGNPVAEEVFTAMQSSITTLNQQCAAGDADAFDAVLDFLFLAESLADLSVFSFDQVADLRSLATCFALQVSPASVVGVVPLQATLTASLVNANGDPTGFALDASNFFWTLPDGSNSSENPLLFQTETPGSALVTGFLRSLDQAEVRIFGIPDLTGPYTANASGSAAGCNDPEDNGSGSGSGNVTIFSQATPSQDPPVAVLGVTGGGGDVLITSMSLTVTFAAGADLTGTVTGFVNFTQSEPDEDEDGNPIIIVTTGSLGLNGSFANGSFNLSAQGSDSSGCSLSGTLTLGG